MTETDDSGAGADTNQHPVLTKFRETMRRLGGSDSVPPAAMARETRKKLRRHRMELQAEVDALADEELDTESCEEDIVAATA
jgi:hypothetical protein